MNFVEWLTVKYGDIANDDIAQVPRKVRPIMTVLAAHFPILNGGYRYLLENDFESGLKMHEIMEAYEEIGLTEISKSISEIMKLFPNGDLPDDLDEREIYLKKYFDEDIEDNYGNEIKNESYSKLVSQAEDLYYSLYDSIEGRLEDYYCRTCI